MEDQKQQSMSGSPFRLGDLVKLSDGANYRQWAQEPKLFLGAYDLYKFCEGEEQDGGKPMKAALTIRKPS